MSFRPLTPPGASGHTHTHVLHAHIIAYTFYPLACWSLRAAGLALDPPCWLDVWQFSLSLEEISFLVPSLILSSCICGRRGTTQLNSNMPEEIYIRRLPFRCYQARFGFYLVGMRLGIQYQPYRTQDAQTAR